MHPIMSRRGGKKTLLTPWLAWGSSSSSSSEVFFLIGFFFFFFTILADKT
jgi:hypothetical protein